MRRVLLILWLLFPAVTFGQGGAITTSGIVAVNALGRPIGNATVTICAFGATGIPCSPTITVYTDPTLGTPATNPATADGNGNVYRYANPGRYTITVTGTGITGTSFTATVAGSGGGDVISAGTNTFTGSNTFTGGLIISTTAYSTSSAGTHGGTETFTGTTNLAVHSGTIEADVQCTVSGVLDQSCFTNSIALLNNSTLTAIHFKSGTWPITSNITTTKQVSFYCDGEHSTIFQPTGAVTTALTINNTGGGTGEQYGVYGCGFDMTSAPTATAISLSGINRPHVDRVDIRYPNAITSTGTGITLVNIAQTDFLRTFIRNAGICVLDNGDGGLEHHLENVTCESPLIAGLKVTRTAAPDVGAVYVAQVRVTNPFARVGGVGYWLTSSVGSTGTPFFLAQIVADSQLGESVAISADNATCASAGYCQTSASVGTFLTAAQSPVYSVGQLVTIAGVTGGTCGTAPNGRYPIASVTDSTHFTIAFTGTATQHCGAGTAALSADGLVIENMAGGTISISDSWFANLTAQANKNCATRFKNANNIKLTNNFIQSAWGEVCIEGAVTNIQVSNNDFESGAAGSNTWVLDDRLGVATTISGWRVSNNNYNDTNFAILASTAADATGTFVTGSASNNVATGMQFLTRGDGGITQEIVFKNTEAGASNAIKSWRVNSVGNLELLNNAHSPMAYWTNAGVFGTVSDITPQTAGAANLGQLALPFANLFLGTNANSLRFQQSALAASRVVTVVDPGAAVTLDFTSNTSTTTTQVLHASATAGVSTYSAIATADIASALTTPGPIGGTTPSTGKFTSETATSLLWTTTAPTITGAGCGGSAATISANNGTAAFSINTGTAPTSACTVTMPASTTGWVCDANTVSATSTTNFIVKQTGAVSTTSVVLTLFTDVAATQSYTAADTVRVKCMAY